MFRYPARIVVCFLFLGASEAFASLVVNGGFETGNYNGWNKVTYADWTLSNTASSSWYYVVGNPVHSGTASAELNGYPGVNTISQNLATVAGKYYTLDFWLDHPLTDTYSSELKAFWNGTPVLHLTLPISSFNWTEYKFTVQATSASTPLMFAGQDTPSYFYLDDISVVPTDAQAVPEPSAVIIWSLLGVAGIALGLKRVRRKAG